MLILGIDPGYGRLGYALLKKEGSLEKIITYSCIETSPKKEIYQRLIEITNGVEKIIKKYKPDVLAIEKIFFTKNQKTAIKIAEIRGIIIYIALKNKLSVTEYGPLEVKSAVCGYGNAPKEQVKKMVMMILGIKNEIKLDDTSDAIALCLTCSSQKKYIN